MKTAEIIKYIRLVINTIVNIVLIYVELFLSELLSVMIWGAGARLPDYAFAYFLLGFVLLHTFVLLMLYKKKDKKEYHKDKIFVAIIYFSISVYLLIVFFQ